MSKIPRIMRLMIGTFALARSLVSANQKTCTHLFLISDDSVGLVVQNGSYEEPSTIVGRTELSDSAISATVTNLLGLNATENSVNKDALMQFCLIEQILAQDNSIWMRLKTRFGYPPEYQYLDDSGLKKQSDLYYIALADKSLKSHDSQVKWLKFKDIDTNDTVNPTTRLFLSILRDFKTGASTDVSSPIFQLQEAFKSKNVKAEIIFTVPAPLFGYLMSNNTPVKEAFKKEKEGWDFVGTLLVIPAIPLFIVIDFTRFLKG